VGFLVGLEIRAFGERGVELASPSSRKLAGCDVAPRSVVIAELDGQAGDLRAGIQELLDLRFAVRVTLRGPGVGELELAVGDEGGGGQSFQDVLRVGGFGADFVGIDDAHSAGAGVREDLPHQLDGGRNALVIGNKGGRSAEDRLMEEMAEISSLGRGRDVDGFRRGGGYGEDQEC
jgi:hypothetical protein